MLEDNGDADSEEGGMEAAQDPAGDLPAMQSANRPVRVRAPMKLQDATRVQSSTDDDPLN